MQIFSVALVTDAANGYIRYALRDTNGARTKQQNGIRYYHSITRSTSLEELIPIIFQQTDRSPDQQNGCGLLIIKTGLCKYKIGLQKS